MENTNEIDFGEVNKDLAAINDSDVTQCVKTVVDLQMSALLSACKTFSVEIKKYKNNNAILAERVKNCQNELSEEHKRNDWSINLLKNLSKGIADDLNRFYKNNPYSSTVPNIFEGLKKAFKNVGINIIFYKPGERIPEDAKMTVLQESQGVTRENEKTVCECLGVTFMHSDEIIVEGKVSVYNSSSVNKAEDNSFNKSDLYQKNNNVDAVFLKKGELICPIDDEIKKLFYVQRFRGIEYCLPKVITLGKKYPKICYMNSSDGKPIRITDFGFYIDKRQQLVLRVFLGSDQYLDYYFSYIDDDGKNRGELY